jgi:hypothetical protein
MDIDHEARKHKAPRSTVVGEAKRTAAEDPSDQIQEVLDDAKATVDRNDSDDHAKPKRERARSHGPGNAESARGQAERPPQAKN